MHTRVQRFEEASGLDIDTYDSGRIGRATRVVAQQRLLHEDDLLNPVLRELESTLAEMRTIQRALRTKLHPEEAKEPS
ncbi:MAG: hypothetical protein JRD89_08700 [Deltaproteobacteria bacterium]|nr:hypothetical protein [Deltaproteobacteria bacterium]